MSTTSQIRYDHRSVKWLKKADPQIARIIRDALVQIATLDDPQAKGKALTGNLKGLWRYRVGDYRIICQLINTPTSQIILVLDIGHRSSIYTPDIHLKGCWVHKSLGY